MERLLFLVPRNWENASPHYAILILGDTLGKKETELLEKKEINTKEFEHIHFESYQYNAIENIRSIHNPSSKTHIGGAISYIEINNIETSEILKIINNEKIISPR